MDGFIPTNHLEVASEENCSSLLQAFYGSPDVKAFLRDDDIKVPLFSTVLDYGLLQVNYDFDFDGLVVTVADVSRIKAGIHFLFLEKVDRSKVSNHWHILKKHLDLRMYSREGVSALRKSMGTVLSYIDGGYFLNLTCVPANPNCAHPMFRSQDAVRANTIERINAVYHTFAKRLKSLPPQELERPSIQKKIRNHLGKMNVLHSDQEFILHQFQEALSSISSNIDMELLLTISKFGQKDGREFDLGSLIEKEGVVNVSYHVACNISPVDPTIDLFWSRRGLQKVVGTRGALFPVYSMRETANFQSNLDQVPLEIAPELRRVFRDVGTLNFVQLYANTPHCHLSTAAFHPISRIITMCDLHNEKHRRMLGVHATSYVQLMDDLVRKSVSRVSLRMEAVFLVPGDYQQLLHPIHFFHTDNLEDLFYMEPMVVPFKDNEDGLGLRHVVQPVVSYLSTTLLEIGKAKKGLGGFINSWTAFQLELALEEFFYSRTLCQSTRQYAAPLGVCPVHDESVTRKRGFLGLAPVGSASVGESPLPLSIWLKDEDQRLRVERIFPLTDCLQSSPIVVGEELLRVLLFDLYELNTGLSMANLKGPQRPHGNLVSCRSVPDFAQELCLRKGFGYPHTFGRALELVKTHGLVPFQCLESALSALKYFPQIRYWDEQRHSKAKWNFKDYVGLHKETEIPSVAARAAALRGDVCARIETMDLAFARTVKKYRDNGMPWLERCIERLPKVLRDDQLLTVLVFLSCVGIIQNGDYICFQKLDQLESSLPVTQKRLRELCILSNLILIRKPLVWRFHEAIPHKVFVSAAPPAPNPRRRRHRQDTESDEVLEADEEEPEPQVIVTIQSDSVPANRKGRWSSLEMSYIDLSPQMTQKGAYDIYLRCCKENSTPVRTFDSFNIKRRRLIAEA